MADVDVGKLCEQLDAARRLLDQAMITSRCDELCQSGRGLLSRDSAALDAAQRALEQRRQRNEFFGSRGIFGEPAWDLLLDIFIHEARGEPFHIFAGVDEAGRVPTEMRWSNVLESAGFIVSAGTVDHERRRSIKLTRYGHESMTKYLLSLTT